MKLLFLLIFIGLLGSCEPKAGDGKPPQSAPGSKGEAPSPSPTPRNPDGVFTGFNSSGETESCKEMKPGTICTQVFTEDDKFGADCEKAGYERVQCECHKWLCEVAREEFTCGTAKMLKCKDDYRCEFDQPQDPASSGICVPR